MIEQSYSQIVFSFNTNYAISCSALEIDLNIINLFPVEKKISIVPPLYIHNFCPEKLWHYSEVGNSIRSTIEIKEVIWFDHLFDQWEMAISVGGNIMGVSEL